MERDQIAAVFTGFVCLLVLFVTGCANPQPNGTSGKPTSVRGYMPVLNTPTKPQLDTMTPEELAAYNNLPASLKVKLVKNSDSIMLYALQLQSTLDSYNNEAAASNKTTDAALGIQETPTK